MLLLVGIIFIIGYVLITLEHRISLNKSVSATALGAILWVVIALSGDHNTEEAIHNVSAETFSLVVFLLAAMTLVEVLIHYRFFDFLRIKLFELGLKDKQQLILISVIAFFLSAVIDNLTTTIVMVQIARRFFRGKNLLIAAGSVVVAANAGGAFSPIGDVTTIMLWLAHKFTAGELILWGFLPSLSILFVSTYLLSRQMTGDTKDEALDDPESIALSKSEKIVIASTFSSFAFPLIAHLVHLPPFMGLLFGLGMVGLIICFFTHIRPRRESHLSLEIEKLLAKVDITSLLFFIGILFAVGALAHLGILASISASLFGEEPTVWRLVSGSVLLGVFSAIVDNIPLTAAAINILQTTDFKLWVLLALCVGTGGSMLVIGSAAGVVAMGMVKDLNFKQYVHIVALPAAAGYITSIVVWCLQYILFG